uniref:CSN8/PSMD8/EIF3K domain-containing protein n=1 Tax=Spongospora subterranea TaxID=70186 RepID=A0A0H5R4W2_9EUKA|eukprot:CRZ08926.1 hypothetical protein [Spongospora subterranea]
MAESASPSTRLLLSNMVASGALVYDESLISDLESKITSLSASGSSLPLAPCLYLLRLYRIYPSRASQPCVLRILLSQLTAPGTAFLSCEMIIPPSMYEATEIRQVQQIADSAQSSKYGLMWTQIAQYQSMINEYCPEFNSRIRVNIAQVLARTFSKISIAQASDFLKEDSVENLLKLNSDFTIDTESGVIRIASCAESSRSAPDAQAYPQKVTFDMVKKLEESAIY